MSTITIGADPEVFVCDQHNTIISAIGHVGGSKEQPVPVVNGAVQEDNVLAEYNISPARTSEEFVAYNKSVLAQLRERIAPNDVVIRSSHIFEKRDLIRSGRKALMFGCDPDFNAWTEQQNIPPSPLTTLRTAGGHIHVGYENSTKERNIEIIKNMDVLLGLPSVLLDDDSMRRNLYGAAGCFRHKHYGVEYRTLSNFWLQHTDLMSWAFKQAVRAAEEDLIVHDDGTIIQEVINTSNKAMAEKMIHTYGVTMP